MKSLAKFALFSLLLTNTLFAGNDSTVPIHGFFDLDARYIGKENKSKLATGYLDFYITKSISDKITVLMDVVFETKDDEYAVDIERINITYDVNEYLRITSGKFHSPYGYWNTAFHHGLQLQTSILRPKFLAFEDRGGVLPSHSVGIKATGNFDNLSYDFYVTSGVHIKNKDEEGGSFAGIISTSNGEHQDGKKLFGATLAYDMEDTKIGLHSFYQNVNIFNQRSTDVLMSGAFIAMELERFELYSELYLFHNKNILGSTGDEYLFSKLFFAQAAYAFGNIKPYLRVETAHYNQSDFYFAAQSATAGFSYDRAALGIAYNIADDATIKFASIANKDKHKEANYDFLAQFAVRF